MGRFGDRQIGMRSIVSFKSSVGFRDGPQELGVAFAPQYNGIDPSGVSDVSTNGFSEFVVWGEHRSGDGRRYSTVGQERFCSIERHGHRGRGWPVDEPSLLSSSVIRPTS